MTHIPVLLQEMLHYLDPQDNCTYIDATFGGGGYTRAILKHSNCNVIAFDRDENAVLDAQKMKEEFGERFTFVSDKFSTIKKHIHQIGRAHV